MPSPTPDLIAAAERLRADAETVAAAAERMAVLHAVCSEAHGWLVSNTVGDLPGLAAIVARLSAVLDEGSDQ